MNVTRSGESGKKRAPRAWSIRAFTLLLVGAVILLFTICFFSIFHATMPNMLLEAERKYMEEQRSMVRGMIQNALDDAYSMTDDLAIWENSVLFVEGEYDSFLEENWPDRHNEGVYIADSYGYNFALYKNREAQTVYLECYDYTGDRQMSDANRVMYERLAEHLTQLARDAMEDHRANRRSEGYSPGMGGVVAFEDKFFLVCAMPIMTARDTETPSGVFFLGSLLDDAFFKHLTNSFEMTFRTIRGTDTGDVGEDTLTRSDEFVETYILLDTLEGSRLDEGPIYVGMKDRRSIYSEGQTTINMTIILLLLVMVVFTVSICIIIVRVVARPLEKMSADINRQAFSVHTPPDTYSGGREFTELCRAISGMLGDMTESNTALEATRRILNSVDSHIYVSNPQTGELLFVNDKMRREYGLEGELDGLKCWSVFQSGMEDRCGFCPVPRLISGAEEAVVWEHVSPVTGRCYRKTDRMIRWVDNRLVHIQQGVDITAAKQADIAMQFQLDQQKILTSIAQSFISAEDNGVLITNALRLMGEFVGADRVIIGRYDEDEGIMEFIHQWYRSEEIGGVRNPIIPFAVGAALYDGFGKERKEYTACADTQSDPTYGNLCQFGVRAFLSVPIIIDGKVWGILNPVHCLKPHEWSDNEIYFARLVCSTVTGAIDRGLTDEELVRMSSIVESSPQFIAYLDPQANFIYVNKGVETMMGYDPHDLMHTSALELMDEETRRMVKDEMIPAIMREGRQEFNINMYNKAGDLRVLAVSAFAAGDENAGFGTINSDITERLELERQLVVAKEQAEQSSLAKSEFLSRMSHEMRTPMNAIIGMTTIAKSADDVEKKTYCLDKIETASKHLLGVINDILDMSKIESGKFELSESEFDLEKMLIRVVDVINFKVDEKKQNLIVLLDSRLPHFLHADEQRLSQVITNLLANALKFTPEEGRITLSADLLEEEGDGLCTIRFCVEDTGIGMDEEQRRKLFRSFEQADGSISRRFGGTGLGLAISKKIVDLMGGEFTVTSAPGEGSAFSFVIRAARGSAAPRSLLSPDIRWDALRVLAVDDAPEVREYFKSIAESVGLACDTAESGPEACDLIERNADNPYHIIFVDWKMPEMNGIELTRVIKERYGADIVVIMISSTEWSEIESEATKAGVDRFIPKPLFSSHLVNCVNECLSLEQTTRLDENALEAVYKNNFEGRRILLAEDNDINREIATTLLQDTGIIIDCAVDGREAVDMFRARPEGYDLILMDIHMPEMDGYEATRRIRALPLPRAAAVPIVAMTANVFREDVERCLKAGMNDHIGKPIDTDELFSKLKRYLP